MASFCLALAAGLRLYAPPTADPTRAPAADTEAWRVLSLGHPTAAATFQWIRIVRHHTLPPPDAGWLHDALQPIGGLDPQWKTPWAYGALMARAHGDPSTARSILLEAATLHPDSPWFPRALAAEHLLAEDPEGAAFWNERAAQIGGSP